MLGSKQKIKLKNHLIAQSSTKLSKKVNCQFVEQVNCFQLLARSSVKIIISRKRQQI